MQTINMPIKRLGHGAIFVSDLARSRTFYEDALDMQFSGFDDPTTAFVTRIMDQHLNFMSCGTQHHDLVLVLQGDRKGGTLPVTPDDIMCLSFSLQPDYTLDELMHKLEGLGIHVSPGAVLHNLISNEGSRVIHFQDPDGHLIEVSCD